MPSQQIIDRGVRVIEDARASTGKNPPMDEVMATLVKEKVITRGQDTKELRQEIAMHAVHSILKGV